MDAATLERIFEPFFTTKPVNEGTGLGLSVVLGIVQGHEGTILADSQLGKGTDFTLYLPVLAVQAEVPASAQCVAATAAKPHSGNGQHVLYLDDDESLVYMVNTLLSRRGFRVSGYTKQREALAALRADPAAFDLVLTDYNMPGASGLNVAREVRAIRAELPVAVTSGFIDETLRAQAQDAGVRELIFKANDVEAFCAAVQRLAQTVHDQG
jgi:CheY-like chemotaxis protein